MTGKHLHVLMIMSMVFRVHIKVRNSVSKIKIKSKYIFPPMSSLASTWMSGFDCCQPAAAIGCLYVYDLPLRLASTTCLYDLPLRSACLYGLPLQPASTACLYGLPLRPASKPTACLNASGLLSSYHCHHRHCHRPFPVQAEHLSFSFICDLIFSFFIS